MLVRVVRSDTLWTEAIRTTALTGVYLETNIDLCYWLVYSCQSEQTLKSQLLSLAS